MYLDNVNAQCEFYTNGVNTFIYIQQEEWWTCMIMVVEKLVNL